MSSVAKKTRNIFFVILIATQYAVSQSTFTQVYQLLNSPTCGNNFSSCHNGSGPSGLDFSLSAAQVYDQLYDQSPQNAVAANRKDKLIYPGHPYRSFLFRKINNGLAHNVDLTTGEGTNMPQSSPPLNEKQIELIRQWIIYGAPETGIAADTLLISDFYDNSGISSVENPPIAPFQNEGFQLHLGPYFLAPGTENLGPNGSPFNRFDVPLQDSVEITRIDCFVGNGFHHLGFFIYPDTSYNNQIPYGIIPGSVLYTIVNFNQLENMGTFQHADNMDLPAGTAYQFPYKSPLFIADHYFNSSITNVLSCDIYLNVYYQLKNTALHIMKHQSHNYSDIPSNPTLMLPPDGQTHTFSESIFDSINGETRFIWSILAHSHIHTISYDIYRRNANGTTGAKIYEAGCADGIPDCSSPLFLPSEIPSRYFSDFISVNTSDGFYREAIFRNNGPDTVFSGMHATKDEMMAMAYYYITDTTGLANANGLNTELNKQDFQVLINPNPFNNEVTFNWTMLNTHLPSVLSIYDITGKIIIEKDVSGMNQLKLSSDDFPGVGMFFFNLKTETTSVSGKFVHQ